MASLVTTVEQELLSALKVICLTFETRAYLEANDPQALKQADAAVAKADGTDCERVIKDRLAEGEYPNLRRLLAIMAEDSGEFTVRVKPQWSALAVKLEEQASRLDFEEFRPMAIGTFNDRVALDQRYDCSELCYFVTSCRHTVPVNHFDRYFQHVPENSAQKV